MSDRLSRLKPAKYMMPKDAISESGRVTPATAVALRVRRNRSTTSTTRTTESPSVNCTSRTDARMVPVRSAATSTFTPEGSPLKSCGSFLFNRSTVPTILAPGWRCTSMMTAGTPL